MTNDTERHGDDGRSPSNAHVYEWDRSQRPSVAVVEAVADATGRGTTTLDPIQNSIDSDALDALVRSAADGPTYVRVTFAYADVTVTFESDHGIEVRRDRPAAE